MIRINRGCDPRYSVSPAVTKLQREFMGIVLIGYRGSGKTTVGCLLAQLLGWPVVDLDERIVSRAGMTSKRIFELHGEADFRQRETAALIEVLPVVDHVISLGGGAVLASENRSAIKTSGHRVFYLSADPEELHRRITSDPATAANRPNLTGLAGSVEEITMLLDRRDPLYREVMTAEVQVADKTAHAVAIECKLLDEEYRVATLGKLSADPASID
jgi:shikimate kinase